MARTSEESFPEAVNDIFRKYELNCRPVYWRNFEAETEPFPISLASMKSTKANNPIPHGHWTGTQKGGHRHDA